MNDNLGVPSDNTTLVSVLGDYAAAGYAGQFEVMSESAIACLSCGQESDPAQFDMAGLRRLEGASDPDDMLSVIAMACPRCESRGTLVVGFGPNASATDAAVCKQLRDRRGEQSIPPSSAPGE
jgi:hypothetical protein